MPGSARVSPSAGVRSAISMPGCSTVFPANRSAAERIWIFGYFRSVLGSRHVPARAAAVLISWVGGCIVTSTPSAAFSPWTVP